MSTNRLIVPVVLRGQSLGYVEDCAVVDKVELFQIGIRHVYAVCGFLNICTIIVPQGIHASTSSES